jgi:hypothetical protein
MHVSRGQAGMLDSNGSLTNSRESGVGEGSNGC